MKNGADDTSVHKNVTDSWKQGFVTLWHANFIISQPIHMLWPRQDNSNEGSQHTLWSYWD